MVGSTYEGSDPTRSVKDNPYPPRPSLLKTASQLTDAQENGQDLVAPVFNTLTAARGLTSRIHALVGHLIGSQPTSDGADRGMPEPDGELTRLAFTAELTDEDIRSAHDALTRLDNVIGRG